MLRQNRESECQMLIEKSHCAIWWARVRGRRKTKEKTRTRFEGLGNEMRFDY